MFRIVGRLAAGSEPYKYLPGTDAETFTRGEALVMSGGALTKCGATVTAQYICNEDVEAATPAKQNISVSVIRETDEIEVIATEAIAQSVVGSVVTLHTDGLKVTATTTSGVFRVKNTDGLTPSTVVGVFEQ